MVAQKGRDILIKVSAGVSPDVYTTLMGVPRGAITGSGAIIKIFIDCVLFSVP